jgi:hypothetical protein
MYGIVEYGRVYSSMVTYFLILSARKQLEFADSTD